MIRPPRAIDPTKDLFKELVRYTKEDLIYQRALKDLSNYYGPFLDDFRPDYPPLEMKKPGRKNYPPHNPDAESPFDCSCLSCAISQASSLNFQKLCLDNGLITEGYNTSSQIGNG